MEERDECRKLYVIKQIWWGDRVVPRGTLSPLLLQEETKYKLKCFPFGSCFKKGLSSGVWDFHIISPLYELPETNQSQLQLLKQKNTEEDLSGSTTGLP